VTKRPGREADLSSSVEFKNECSYTFISLRAVKERKGTILTSILTFTNVAMEEILYLYCKKY